jgi:hypothetical protein
MIFRITGDPMAGAHDAAELLDVDVKEFSGMLTLVAYHGRGGIQGSEAVKTMPLQDPGHSRLGEPALTGNLEARHPQSPQGENDGFLGAWCATRTVMGA